MQCDTVKLRINCPIVANFSGIFLFKIHIFFLFFSPYSSADLRLMAGSFNTSVASLEDELMTLILEGKIQARIDSHNKVNITFEILNLKIHHLNNDIKVVEFHAVLSFNRKYKFELAIFD